MKKKKVLTIISCVFTWLMTIFSAVAVVGLVFGFMWLFGLAQDMGWLGDVGWGALAVVIIFVVGLIAGGIAVLAGLILSLTSAILFTVAMVKKGKLPLAQQILATLAAVVYIVFFVLAAIMLFDFTYGFSIVLGIVALSLIPLELLWIAVAWLSVAEGFKGKKKAKAEESVEEAPVEEVANPKLEVYEEEETSAV